MMMRWGGTRYSEQHSQLAACGSKDRGQCDSDCVSCGAHHDREVCKCSERNEGPRSTSRRRLPPPRRSTARQAGSSLCPTTMSYYNGQPIGSGSGPSLAADLSIISSLTSPSTQPALRASSESRPHQGRARTRLTTDLLASFSRTASCRTHRANLALDLSHGRSDFEISPVGIRNCVPVLVPLCVSPTRTTDLVRAGFSRRDTYILSGSLQLSIGRSGVVDADRADQDVNTALVAEWRDRTQSRRGQSDSEDHPNPNNQWSDVGSPRESSQYCSLRGHSLIERAFSHPLQLARTQEPNLSLCRPNHPFLKVALLEEEASKLLEECITTLFTGTNADLVSALTTSLTALVKVRNQFTQLVVTALTNWAPTALAGQSYSQIKSVEKVIRISLTHLLR